VHAEPFEPAGVVWSPVSPRLVTARRITTLVVAAVPIALFAFIALASGTAWPWVLVAVIGVIAVWSLWLIGRQARAIGYAERDEELLVRTGIAWRRIVVVPYGRLQYVDVLAGPLDRALGIARVQLHTASAGSDAAIPGLPPEEAARLRDRLTARGQSNLAGL
jgi:membrane protein YdbS with pleckstrin-like domain